MACFRTFQDTISRSWHCGSLHRCLARLHRTQARQECPGIGPMDSSQGLPSEECRAENVGTIVICFGKVLMLTVDYESSECRVLESHSCGSGPAT